MAGCEALPSSSTATTTPADMSAVAGTLQVNITDAPAKPEIEQVWVTVAGVKIHTAGNETTTQTTSTTTTTETTTEQTESDNGWQSLALVGDARFNLLDYQNGLQSKLALGPLPPGTYTQIRMDVTKVEIKLKGDTTLIEAKLPSGTLKFVHPFDIVSGQVTEITFDFNALQSVKETGNGKYMCNPVIKLTTTKEPKAGGDVKITTFSVPNGGVGSPYDTVTFAATGGTSPYTWNISAGTIPTSLTFDGTAGTLSGTPTAAGTFTFTVQATDKSSPVKKNATKEFTVNIAPANTLQITTTNLPDGVVGTAYPTGIALNAVGGTGTLTWTLDAGSLPAGLSLNAVTGAISGTPTAKGNYSFTIKVTDSNSQTDTQVITISIYNAP